MTKTEILEGLDQYQKQIVTTKENSLIIAGAGSGKTRTLIKKIIYLIEILNKSPENILAITFTRAGKEEMQERLISEIGEKAKLVEIRTIHSLSLSIIKANIDKLDSNFQKLNLVTNFMQRKIIEQIIYDLTQKHDLKKTKEYEQFSNNKFYYTSNIITQISKFKSNKYPSNYFLKRNNIQYLSAEYIYSLYQKELRELDLIDFNDMLLLCIDMLSRNKDISNYYKSKFKYMFIDEVQDTSDLQYTFLEMIGLNSTSTSYLFGDDYQSIYAFAGANVNHIVEYKKNLPKHRIFILENNYRSTKQIVNGSNDVISTNTYQIKKVCKSQNKEGTPIILLESSNEEEEMNYIIKEIKEKELKNVCILVNSLEHTKLCKDKLLESHIPYEIIGEATLLNKCEVISVLNKILILIDSSNNGRVANFLLDTDIGIKTYKYLLSKVKKENKSLYTILNSYLELKKRERNKIDIINQKINKSIEYIQDIDDIVYKISNLYNIEITSSLEELQKIISTYHYNYPDESLSNILSSILVDYSEDINNVAKEKNTVKVMTYWKSKGLEFDTVFMLRTVENGFMLKTQGIEFEEYRRVFYVAMTRAKERLYICYPLLIKDKVTNKHRCIKELLPQHSGIILNIK